MEKSRISDSVSGIQQEKLPYLSRKRNTNVSAMVMSTPPHSGILRETGTSRHQLTKHFDCRRQPRQYFRVQNLFLFRAHLFGDGTASSKGLFAV